MANPDLERVTKRVFVNGNPEERSVPTPLLTLEEFFDGNEELGSIGCNLLDVPPPSRFAKVFEEIRSRAEVSDVRIQISHVDMPGEEWPFSDTVWIITTASPETVQTWLPEDIEPDICDIGSLRDHLYEPVEVAQGHKTVALWYD